MKLLEAIFSARVVISSILAAASLLLAFWPWPFWDPAESTKPSTRVRGAVLALWSILPPLWFLVEYSMLQGANAQDIANLKYLQDLSSKLWAGMLAALTVLYFGKDILKR